MSSKVEPIKPFNLQKCRKVWSYCFNVNSLCGTWRSYDIGVLLKFYLVFVSLSVVLNLISGCGICFMKLLGARRISADWFSIFQKMYYELVWFLLISNRRLSFLLWIIPVWAMQKFFYSFHDQAVAPSAWPNFWLVWCFFFWNIFICYNEVCFYLWKCG